MNKNKAKLFKAFQTNKLNYFKIASNKLDKNNAEDILQNVALKLLTTKSKIDKPTQYIAKAVLHERYFDSSKLWNKRQVKLNKCLSESVLLNSESTELVFAEYEPLKDAIKLLSPKQAAVIKAYLADNTLIEISRATKINQNTVKANFRHALGELRTTLSKQGLEFSDFI